MGCGTSSETSAHTNVEYLNDPNRGGKGDYVTLQTVGGYPERTPKMRGPGTGNGNFNRVCSIFHFCF